MIRGVFALLWGLWGREITNYKVFRGGERDRSDVCCFLGFHVSMWALVSTTFCNYILCNNFTQLELLSLVGIFVGLDFCMSLYYFFFMSQ